jgi:hypothetical protein
MPSDPRRRDGKCVTIAALAAEPGWHDCFKHTPWIPTTTFEGELNFQRAEKPLYKTMTSFRGGNGCNAESLAGCVVIIQLVFQIDWAEEQDIDETSDHGDLSKPAEKVGQLYRFAFNPSLKDSPIKSSAQMDLDHSLSLGVGSDRMVGRRVSVFRDTSMRARVAEGIIGWN